MPTFNATAGRAASSVKINERSNRFAANMNDRFKDLTMDEREALMDHLDAVVADLVVAKQFAAGTYAQDSTGRPAKALGAGTTTSGTTPAEAWEVIMADPSYSEGQKKAAIRIFNSGDPAVIKVNKDGTPIEIAAQNTTITDLTSERDAMKAERDKAQKELKDERTKKAPANMVDKSTLAAEKDALKKLLDNFDNASVKGITVSRKTAQAIVTATRGLLAKL